VDGALDEIPSTQVGKALGAGAVLEDEVGDGDVGSRGSIVLDMRVPSAAHGHRPAVRAHHQLNPMKQAEHLSGHQLAGLHQWLHAHNLCPRFAVVKGGVDRTS